MNALLNYCELNITKADARSGSHQGQCDADVAALLKKPYIRRQLDKIPDATIARELLETGGWSVEELQDRAANEARLIWLACGNIVDNIHERAKR